MNDTLQSARADLAFMREVAEDRGRVPSHLGAHLFWPGLLYGLNVLYCWAGLAGFVPWPSDWIVWAWAPSTVVYIPIVIWLSFRGVRMEWGPGARSFAAAWSGVGLMTMTIVTVVTVASYRMHVNYAVVWPSIALALYASAWLATGILLKRPWAILVAGGCSLAAIIMSFLIDSPLLWLVMGIGMLLFMAIPGAVLMRKKSA